MAKPLQVPWDQQASLLQYLSSLPGFVWEGRERKALILDEKGERLLDFRLALPTPDRGTDLQAYLSDFPEEPIPYALILIQAGAAALGYFEEGEAVEHKAIKKYMIRGRGKAQVAYLKTRGKSKAGSRLRLRNSIQFFEEINEKLQEWELDSRAKAIFYACPVRLWPLLFESKVKTPFDKKDPRLQKVPRDIPVPRHEVLLETADFLHEGRLFNYGEVEIPRMW